MAITPGTDYSAFPIPTADAATNASDIRTAIGAMANTSAALVTVAQAMNATQEASMRTAIGSIVDVTGAPYNAVADGMRVDTASMTSGLATLTATGANFQSSDVGKFIRVVGAGVAGADLVTTIAARASTTSITLTNSASTSVTNSTAFYGTDNTTAIQSAIAAAAASASTKTVYIPAGIYLCNVVVTGSIVIEGSNPKLNQSTLPSPSSLASSYTDTTILMPALGTPVIHSDSCSGLVLKRFCVFGTNAKTGHGIRLGTDDGTVLGFVGQCIKVEQVWVSGFKYCFAASRVADITYDICQASTGTYGWNMAEVDTIQTLRYTDGITITSCTSVGVETVFRFQGSKNAVINSGDYNSSGGTNDMLRLVEMLNTNLCITSVNVENPGSDVIRKTDGSLVVNTIKVLNGLGGLIQERGTSSNTVVNSCELSGETFGSSSALNVLWKGITGRRYPTTLPKGAVLAWYSDNTFTTLADAEYSSLIYGKQLDIMNLQDFFSRATSTAPFGAVGWTSTNISGSFAGRIDGLSNLFEWYSTGGATANLAGRFSFEREIMNVNELFELRIVLADANPTSGSSICRIGVYSHDASITPVDGVGFRVDRAASTNIFFETINNGVITSVDTGVAASTTMSGLKEFIIRRTAQGTYGVIRNDPTTNPSVAASVKLNSGSLRTERGSPALYWGTTAVANYATCRIREFSFRRLVSSSFL
jgi:hypothetical protein